ncbi:MAG: SUMF1/EgtB/PvdO family nonheme iron enzyme [Phycisphaerales bacterium]
MTRALCFALAATTLGAIASVPAFAQGGLHDYGFDFVTVGAPGNAPVVLPQQNGNGPPIEMGQVNYSFRVTRTEVTKQQWLGFIDAYRPYLGLEDYGDPQFSGRAAVYAGIGPDGLPGYQVLSPETLDRPVTPSWEYIARYMNWMHNGAKPIHEATFEDFNAGAYNMDDFGTSTPVVRQEGARFFMMNYDEWTKAVYYDPDRHGEGEPGYWTYPNQSDTPPVPGAPGEGETSGTWAYRDDGGLDAPPPVGAYGVETPWGLLDASGGESEWLETYARTHPNWNATNEFRPIVGSYTNSSGNSGDQWDQIGYLRNTIPDFALHGFRVATVVPCADANADGVVNFADLNAVLAGFGQSGEGILGDLNGDGTVDFADLNEVLAAFGTVCE